jgi:two-component system OmpR family sensor kinase
VLAGVVTVTLVALAAFDLAAVAALRGYLVGQTDSKLGTVLSLYRPLHGQPVPPRKVLPDQVPAGERQAVPLNAVIAGPRLKLPGVLAAYNVTFAYGGGRSWELVKGGPGLTPRQSAALLPPLKRQARTVAGGRNVQLRIREVPVGGGTLIASTSLGNVNSTLDRLALIVIVGSLAAGLAVALGVAWIMRRGLHPIETMAEQADRITAGDLTDRVSQQDDRSEVGRLGAALNGMLARIEAAVREQAESQELTRRFFADASHELRNPLASLRANAELYQQGALPQRPQVDEAMRRIGLEAQRMSRLVDDMLRLARLDKHPGQEHDLVDLTALIRESIERARIASPQRAWQERIADGLEATGDEELLRRAVDNLLANVQAHTPSQAVATITGAARDGSVTIDVSDDGPGVPGDQLPRIFDRFYRAQAPAQRPGSGLGLAIVSAIVTAHHGTTRARLNQPHGLRITLTLPTADRPCQESGARALTPNSHAIPAAP